MTSRPGPTLLELRGVRRTFTRGPEVVEALRGIDLTLTRGRIDAIVGASGSGKTTLLNVAGGVDLPTEGAVLFEGRRVDTASESARTELRRKHVGMIFQDFCLVPGLTAVENVRLPLVFSGGGDKDRALELMQETEIFARRSFYPHQLSGGEQQRVAIARSLIQEPSLLLADEPTGNLDSEQAARILDILRSLVDSRNLTVLIATHDLELAARTDRSLRLRDGVLI